MDRSNPTKIPIKVYKQWNKVNYVQAINFLSLFHVRREECNSKYEAESREAILSDVFLVAVYHFYCVKMQITLLF